MRGEGCVWQSVRGVNCPWIITISVVFATSLSGRVLAHGEPAPLAFWGNYGTGTARCQRVISRAAELCAARALDARIQCFSAELEGGECDTAAVDAQIRSARADAVGTVSRFCSEVQTQNLLYFGVADALSDVSSICRSLEETLTALVFDPVMEGGSVVRTEEPTRICVKTTAEASRRLLWFAVRQWRRIFDEIASRGRSPAQKVALVDLSAERIARARASGFARIDNRCPGVLFESIYGQSIDDFLGFVVTQSDCLAGAVYVQDAVACPAN
jgi:hypothetical protein